MFAIKKTNKIYELLFFNEQISDLNIRLNISYIIKKKL